MFNISFGVKLNNEEKGMVFGNKDKYKNYLKARNEAEKILNETIKEMFGEIKTDGFIEIPKDYKAWYPDNPNQYVTTRLDGTFNEGEFYILITEDK